MSPRAKASHLKSRHHAVTFKDGTMYVKHGTRGTAFLVKDRRAHVCPVCKRTFNLVAQR
jgi:hypothetical protein